MSTDPSESSNDYCSEETTSNIIEDLETDEGSLTCSLCEVANEHPCQKCGRPVCNLVCSIPDPSSDNEMRRVHKHGDTRCIQETFECPTCNNFFPTSTDLQEHAEGHAQESSASLMSHANSSDWMLVNCSECDKKFENKADMGHHLVRVHEYGESCFMYPCENCGFIADDVLSL